MPVYTETVRGSATDASAVKLSMLALSKLYDVSPVILIDDWAPLSESPLTVSDTWLLVSMSMAWATDDMIFALFVIDKLVCPPTTASLSTFYVSMNEEPAILTVALVPLADS